MTSDFRMGPTCEEVIADIVRKRVNSYTTTAENFYHIQTKSAMKCVRASV